MMGKYDKLVGTRVVVAADGTAEKTFGVREAVVTEARGGKLTVSPIGAEAFDVDAETLIAVDVGKRNLKVFLGMSEYAEKLEAAMLFERIRRKLSAFAIADAPYSFETLRAIDAMLCAEDGGEKADVGGPMVFPVGTPVRTFRQEEEREMRMEKRERQERERYYSHFEDLDELVGGRLEDEMGEFGRTLGNAEAEW